MSIRSGMENDENSPAVESLSEEVLNVVSDADEVKPKTTDTQDLLSAAESDYVEEPVPADSVFSPNRPASSLTLENVISEANIKYDEVESFMSALTREISPADFEVDFKTANDFYKAGEYQKAKAAYESILVKCPVHLGARNNYVLTLAQLEEYDAALSESILLGLIHPGYEGNWVNMLIPLYALGYDDDSASERLKDTGLPEGPGFYPEEEENLIDSDDAIHDAFLYNYIYSNMEAEIGAEEINTKMEEFESILQTLKEKAPEDTDYSELLTYLEGLQKIRLKK